MERVLGPSAYGVVPDCGRIAVLRVNGIGDFVVALPALAALRAAYPAAEITYLGARWHVEFLRDRPGPWDRVVAVPAGSGLAGPATAGGELDAFFAAERARRYDVALQLHGGGAHSNPVVRRLGARLTAGCQDRDAPPLDRVLPYFLYQHEVLRFLEVVGLVGAAPVGLEPELAVTAADRAEATRFRPADGRPLVAIHPGAGDPRRRWPAAGFAAVGDALAGYGARVVLVGAAGDREITAAVAAAMTAPAVDLAGRVSLRGTVGLFEQCALVVGNDSGPRHLAAAVGAATVGIYWCGNMITAMPLSRARHRALVSFRTSCPVCDDDQRAGRCGHDASFVADVPVSDVVAAALELVGAVGAAPERVRDPAGDRDPAAPPSRPVRSELEPAAAEA